MAKETPKLFPYYIGSEHRTAVCEPFQTIVHCICFANKYGSTVENRL